MTRLRGSASVQMDRREFLKHAALTAAFGASGLTIPRLTELGRAPFPTSSARDAPVPNRPFLMVCVGDSLMWGQGLSDEQKYSTKVQRYLEANLKKADGSLGRPVKRYCHARSGAVIASNQNYDSNAPMAGTVPDAYWEVPDSYPSVPHQAYWRARVQLEEEGYRSSDVDLVLVDGGINDFNPKARCLESFTDPTLDGNWVRKWTTWRVGEYMRDLCLPVIFQAFPNARVVVTGYFPVISNNSSIAVLAELAKGWKSDVLQAALTNGTISDAIRRNIAGKFFAFVEQSDRGLTDACATWSARFLSPNGNFSNLSERRALFAPVSNRWHEENSYAGSDTYLWRYGEQDSVAPARAAACVQAHRQTDIICMNASMAHPNPRGAQVYTDAVIQTVQPWMARWNFVAPKPLKRMIAVMTPTPQPKYDKTGKVTNVDALLTPVTATVTVQDGDTGGPVPGAMVIVVQAGSRERATYAPGASFRFTPCVRKQQNPEKARDTRPPMFGVVPPVDSAADLDCGSVSVDAPGYGSVILFAGPDPDEVLAQIPGRGRKRREELEADIAETKKRKPNAPDDAEERRPVRPPSRV